VEVSLYQKNKMFFLRHINFKSIALALSLAMLFSCSKKIEEIHRFYQENENIPASETTNFKLTYTLLGHKSLVLTAPVMIDYSNQKDFPFQYFPKHIKIVLINHDTNEKTLITANKAIIYKNPDMAELISNVKITGADGSSLKTGHLFWDGFNRHIFGDDKTVLKQNDEQITGYGFDSSLDFKNVRLSNITGILKVNSDKN